VVGRRKTRALGLEGLVSKCRDLPDQAGQSKHWLKIKNRKHPATEQLIDSLFS
jgi:ATP-dependent DNA ligase